MDGTGREATQMIASVEERKRRWRERVHPHENKRSRYRERQVWEKFGRDLADCFFQPSPLFERLKNTDNSDPSAFEL